jgi:hypothetical protein
MATPSANRARKIAGAAVGTALFLAVGGFGCWLVIGRADRDVAEVVERLAGPAGLTRTTAEHSIWPRFRRDSAGFVFTRWSVAQGRRQDLPVELTARAGARYQRPTTWVVVAGGRAGVPGGGMVRNDLDTMAVPSPGTRPASAPWLGEGSAWGDPGVVDRLFSPEVHAQLAAFPREVSMVAFEDGVIVLQWFEFEADAAVVERAFATAAACLRLAAAPRPAP